MKKSSAKDNQLSLTLLSVAFCILSAILFLQSCQGKSVNTEFVGGGGSGGGQPAPQNQPPPAGAAPSGSQSAAASNYPSLSFSGSGTLTNSGDSYRISQTTQADMTKELLTVDVLKFSSPEGRVNDEVRGKTGGTKYRRISDEAYSAASKQYPDVKDGTFLLFADRITLKNGGNVDLASPLPVFVSPTSKSQYDTLNYRSLVYSAQATGALIGTITMTVSKAAVDGTGVGVSVTTRMAEAEAAGDKKGQFYGGMPIPRDSTYEIDTEKKIITKLVTDTLFWSDQSDKTEKLHMTYKLCTSTVNNQTESYPCK